MASQLTDGQTASNTFRENKNNMTLPHRSYILLSESHGSFTFMSHACRYLCVTLKGEKRCSGMETQGLLVPYQWKVGKGKSCNVEWKSSLEIGWGRTSGFHGINQYIQVYFSKSLSNFSVFQIYCTQGQTGPKRS